MENESKIKKKKDSIHDRYVCILIFDLFLSLSRRAERKTKINIGRRQTNPEESSPLYPQTSPLDAPRIFAWDHVCQRLSQTTALLLSPSFFDSLDRFSIVLSRSCFFCRRSRDPPASIEQTKGD